MMVNALFDVLGNLSVSRGLSAAAAVLALWAATSRPRHRAVAAGLCLVLAVSLVRTEIAEVRRELGGRDLFFGRLSLALFLAAPAAGAWAAREALCLPGQAPAAWAFGAWVAAAYAAVLGLLPPAWRGEMIGWSLCASIVAQGSAIGAWVGAGRPADLTSLSLGLLLAGDVVAAASPVSWGGPWSLARVSSSLVSLSLVGAHLASEVRRWGTPRGGS